MARIDNKRNEEMFRFSLDSDSDLVLGSFYDYKLWLWRNRKYSDVILHFEVWADLCHKIKVGHIFNKTLLKNKGFITAQECAIDAMHALIVQHNNKTPGSLVFQFEFCKQSINRETASDTEIKCPTDQIFHITKCAAGQTYCTKCAAGQSLLTES